MTVNFFRGLIDSHDNFVFVKRNHGSITFYYIHLLFTHSIDFEKLSKDYDAFHLTEDAFYYMRLPMYDDILKVNYTTVSSEEDKINWKPVVLKDFYAYDKCVKAMYKNPLF